MCPKQTSETRNGHWGCPEASKRKKSSTFQVISTFNTSGSVIYLRLFGKQAKGNREKSRFESAGGCMGVGQT